MIHGLTASTRTSTKLARRRGWHASVRGGLKPSYSCAPVALGCAEHIQRTCLLAKVGFNGTQQALDSCLATGRVPRIKMSRAACAAKPVKQLSEEVTNGAKGMVKSRRSRASIAEVGHRSRIIAS